MKISLKRWQILLVVTLALLNIYAIIQGIRYKVSGGIMLAVASLIALGLCINILCKMNALQNETEEN